MDKKTCVKELINAAKVVKTNIEIVEENLAEKIISQVINKFKPKQLTGHLSIGDANLKLPTERYELSFSNELKKEPGYIFGEQYYESDKKTLIKVENMQMISKLISESFGMEYFLTNESFDYLIAVNWYVIEFIGDGFPNKEEAYKNGLD